MDSKDFYQDNEYRRKQSLGTKLQWQNGLHDHLQKRQLRKCLRPGCKNTFVTIPSDPKRYCSRICAGMVNNRGRVLSLETKNKIRLSMTGKKFPNQRKLPLKEVICANPECKKVFQIERWRKLKYCSIKCAMKVIGGRPTSPKAARAKAGIRPDIDPAIYFFSRWEANFARILNVLNIKWIHQPKRFRLKSQNYTPDFYLPEIDTYIEIKNFLSDYSAQRDQEFRELYPDKELILVLKPDYIDLQTKYSPSIKNWEFS